MKRILLSGLLALLGTGAFAQTSTGTISVGGSISLHSGSTDDNGSKNYSSIFTLSPSVGYFIRDGLEAGLDTRLSFGSNTTKIDGSSIENKTKNFGYAVGPFIRKYISVTDKLHFTATGGFGYENSRSKNPDADEELVSSRTGYYIAATPGLTYFATPKLGFSVTIGNIGYSSATVKDEQTTPKRETDYSNFDFNFSPASASLGIRYFINR